MTTYKSIQGNIKDIIPLYINNNKDNLKPDSIEKLNLLANVRIYGEPENPKYRLKDVARLLGISGSIKKTAEFDDDERELAYIIDDQVKSTKKIYLLTDEGLQRFIYQANTPLGKLFRKCIKFIVDELVNKKVVTLSQVVDNVEKNHIELYKCAALELKKNISKLEEKNRKLYARIEHLTQSEEIMRDEVNKIQYNLDCSVIKELEAKNKLKVLENDYRKLEEEVSTDIDSLQIQRNLALQKKYTKPIYVYLESIPYDLIRKQLKNKNLKNDSILAILGINSYDIHSLDVIYQKDENMLFNIYEKQFDKRKKINKILVHTIWGSSHKIYEKLHKKMYDSDSPYIHEIFQSNEPMLLCTINDIIYEFNNIASF